MSLFVTGTDTGVGKTVVCALVLLRHGRRFGLAYWKPVATGGSTGRDADQVARWTGAPIIPERYRFGPPLSPHAAARRAGRRIDPTALRRAFASHRGRALVIEGVGGALVPLTGSGYLVGDLIRDLRAPCLVVARSTLGTINHTLLTLEALRRRRIVVAGVVLNGPPNPENRRAIERFGHARVMAQVPALRSRTPAALVRAARSFDRAGALGRFLA